MGVADAVMGATKPGLEVPKDTMDARQNLGRPSRLALRVRSVPVTLLRERVVASPAVSDHDRSPRSVSENSRRSAEFAHKKSADGRMATEAAWLNGNRLTERRKRRCALTSTGLLMEGVSRPVHEFRFPELVEPALESK